MEVDMYGGSQTSSLMMLRVYAVFVRITADRDADAALGAIHILKNDKYAYIGNENIGSTSVSCLYRVTSFYFVKYGQLDTAPFANYVTKEFDNYWALNQEFLQFPYTYESYGECSRIRYFHVPCDKTGNYAIIAPSDMLSWGIPGDAVEEKLYLTALANNNTTSVGDFPAVIGSTKTYSPSGVAS